MNTTQNISQLIPSQLPSYIVDDPSYSNFVTFFQAYYEWMELENNSLYGSKNILNYIDIDKTTQDFLQYFCNDFLQYFPKDSLVDKRSAIKFAKELYKSKGTPASYKFLFRILFNSDFDMFFTKDAVLKASDGVWYVAKSLKLATMDPAFLNIANLRIFGESSKSIAVIENSVLSGTKTEVFISNIERLFESGETVRIVDSYNQDVLVNGNQLRAKLVGQISQIKINPVNRGLYYSSGDPVVVYGGLNTTVETPVEATAVVGTTTTGSIQRISVTDGGFGYNGEFSLTNPYSSTKLSITNAPGAIAHVSSVTSDLPPMAIIVKGGDGYFENDYVIKGDINNYVIIGDVTSVDANGAILNITYRNGLDVNLIYGITANVVSRNANAANALIKVASTPGKGSANATYIVKDTLQKKTLEVHTDHENGYLIGNTTHKISYYFDKMQTANIDTKLSDAFTFEQFRTYAISSVIVDNGGGDIRLKPVISADSIYMTDVWDPNDPNNLLGQNIQGNLANMGILAPIQIVNPGVGYVANDKIQLVGGRGYGAIANVFSVDSSGGIVSVDYIYPNPSKIEYPLGGMGYTQDQLPTTIINSSNVSARDAILVVPSILGAGATFSPSVDRVGEITTINVTEFGEDYITTPNVSLKVQDIVVSNVSLFNQPTKLDVIYQGSSINTATYIASVDSLKLLSTDLDPLKNLYSLRVYNYNSIPKPESKLKIGDSIVLDMDNKSYANNFFYPGSPAFDDPTHLGVKVYGDGTAKATASFLNGLNISQGQYLSTRGQPSAYTVLQNEDYNNYTYQITVEAEISKYRDILLNLLHPTGMKVIGRYAIKSNSHFNYSSTSSSQQGAMLADYTGTVSSNATMVADWTNKSNNIVRFDNLNSAKLSSIFSNTSILILSPTNGNQIKSEVVQVNYDELPNNLITYESEFDHVSWDKNTSTVTANTMIAPDGTLTADLITSPADNGPYKTVSPGNGVVVTNSIYIKNVDATELLFRDDSGEGRHLVINPATGKIISTVGSILSCDSVYVGNGWYRYIMTYTTTTTTARCWVRNNISATTKSFYLWKASIAPGVMQQKSITLKDNVWLTFANVAYGSGTIGTPTLYVTGITNSYDIINNGNYSNTENKLEDIAFSGDKLKIENSIYTIDSINYEHNIITLTTNLSSTVNNLISINRTLSVGGSVPTKEQILILDSGVTEKQYLITENSEYFTTENDYFIELG